MTDAAANSRNGFSVSHLADDAEKWPATLVNDKTDSMGRLLRHIVQHANRQQMQINLQKRDLDERIVQT